MSVSIVSRPITSLRGTDVTATDLDSSALVINDWSYSGANKYGVSISSSTVKSLYIENSIDFKNGTGIITLSRPASATDNLQLYWPTVGGTLALETEVTAAIAASGGGSTFGLNSLNVFTLRNVFRKTLDPLTLTSNSYNVAASTYATNVDIGNTAPITLSGDNSYYYVAAVQILPPALTIKVGTGATFTITASAISSGSGGAITGAAVPAGGGGSGYAVNDLLSVIPPSGVGGTLGVLKVTAINTNTTAVTAVTVATAGSGYVTSNNNVVTTVSQMGSTITEASTLHFNHRYVNSGSATRSTTPYITGQTGGITAYVLKISQNSTGGSGFLNAYGAYVTQPSGATNNYALTLNLLALQYVGSSFGGGYSAFESQIGLNIYSRPSISAGNVTTPAYAVIEFPLYYVGPSTKNPRDISTTNLLFKDSVSFVGTDNSTANLFTGTTAKTINIGTGSLVSQTDNITIGSSTGTVGTTAIYAGATMALNALGASGTTTNIATQQNEAGVTKTIEIGTGGLSTSSTRMVFGTSSDTLGVDDKHPTETFLFGTASKNDRQGKISFSSTNFGTTGSSQFSIYVLSAMQTSLLTDTGEFGNTILTSDEGSPSANNQVYIPNNSVCSFEVTASVLSLDGGLFRTATASVANLAAFPNLPALAQAWGNITQGILMGDKFCSSAFVEIAGIASCDSSGKVTIQQITKQTCSRPYLSLVASTSFLSLSTRQQNRIQIAGNGIGIYDTALTATGTFSAYAGKYDEVTGVRLTGTNDNWLGSNSFAMSTDGSNTGLLTIGGAPWVQVTGVVAGNFDGSHGKSPYAYEDALNRNWETGWSKEVSLLDMTSDSASTGYKAWLPTYLTGLPTAQGGTGLFHGAYGKNLTVTAGYRVPTTPTWPIGPGSSPVFHPNIPFGSGTLVRCPQWGLGLGTVVLYQMPLNLSAGETAGGKGRYVIYPKPFRDLSNIKVFAYTVPYMKWTAVVKVTECN